MGYSRRTLNYLERITLYDLNHMISMTNFINIGVETERINSGDSLEKEFIKLICVNP